MSGNANTAFMNNLRPASNPRPAMRTRNSRVVVGSDDKENQVNHIPADTAPSKVHSRLRRPLSAASILESKSGELKAFKLEDAGAVAEASITPNADLLSVLPSDHALTSEVRGSEINFDELLKTKINSKGTTLQDQKKRLDDQKNLILKLRDGLQLSVKIKDFLIGELISKDSTFKTKNEGLEAQLKEALSRFEELTGARTADLLRIEQLIAENQGLTSRLAASTEATQLAEQKFQEISQSYSEVSAHRAAENLELVRLTRLLEEKGRELDEMSITRERTQINHDKELNELRTQLGAEMVSSHEHKSKYTALNELFSDLKTRSAVLDEQCRNGRSEIERLEREREDWRQQVAGLTQDKEAAAARLAESQARCDAQEVQHQDTVRSLMSGQELQLLRLRELTAERDNLATEAARWRRETEEQAEEGRRVQVELERTTAELRISEAELRHVSSSLDGAGRDADALRSQLQEAVRTRGETSERLAVVEAEFKVYKEQAKFPHMEQLELLCKLQVQSDGLQQARGAAEAALQEQRREVERLREEAVELNRRLAAAEAARRKLHNELQEMRGNVRIFGRLRPMTAREAQDEGGCPLELDEETGEVAMTFNRARSQFKFDRLFGPDARQEHVFDEVKHYVQSALDGYNVSLLAYGQTGAGKTHSMMGGAGEERGMIPRCVEHILASVAEMGRSGWEYALEASCLEIYNETVRDLLADAGAGGGSGDGESLQIRLTEGGGQAVADLTTVPIRTAGDVSRVMGAAERRRTVRGTDMNERSSRSHTVLQLAMTGIKGRQRLQGCLSLVDLAGSERLDRSHATGDRLKETQAINKSLSALADVFSAISARAAHVPFRNSKLTHLLQPCLSGGGKALVLMALSPAPASAHESLCTLRFAALVSQCHLGKPTKHVATVADADEDPLPAAAAAAAPAAAALGGGKRPLSAPQGASDKRRRPA